ncbi:unnamed protein product [Penicillium camemberti]|uniref:Str. FM013 n=1 Tax=Penicillium camemberti (strain FM 013) TaxID=1429867 RepID=A0A0G4PHU3_PENC3|nr:unnamed protein product [Penicillium camemberti]
MVALWIFVALGYLLLYAFAVMQTQEWLGDKWAASVQLLPCDQFVSCSAADWHCAIEA